MHDLINAYIEVFQSVSFLFKYIFLFFGFSFLFNILRFIFEYSVSSCDSDSKYISEIQSMLSDSPTETIDNILASGKDYLLDYFCKHIDEFYYKEFEFDENEKIYITLNK